MGAFFGKDSNPYCGPFNAPVSKLPPGMPKAMLFNLYLNSELFQNNGYYNTAYDLIFSGYFLFFVIVVFILVTYYKDRKMAQVQRLLENATDMASEERSEKEALIKQNNINMDHIGKMRRSPLHLALEQWRRDGTLFTLSPRSPQGGGGSGGGGRVYNDDDDRSESD